MWIAIKKNLVGSRKMLVDTFRVCFMDFMLIFMENIQNQEKIFELDVCDFTSIVWNFLKNFWHAVHHRVIILFFKFFADENLSFKNILDQIPSHESLKDLIERIQPFWQSTIVPTIRDGQRVLIVAHGTSLRALGESQIELWSILFNGLENTY